MGFTFSVACSGVSLGKKDIDYLQHVRGDQRGEYEGNNQVGADDPENMRFSAGSLDQYRIVLIAKTSVIESPNKSLFLSGYGDNHSRFLIWNRLGQMCFVIQNFSILGREYSAFIMYKGIPQ